MRDGRAKPRRSSGGVRAAQSAREGVPGRGGPAVLARPSLAPPDRKQPFGGPLLPSKRQERQSPEPRLAEERTGAKAPMEAGGLLAGGPGKKPPCYHRRFRPQIGRAHVSTPVTRSSRMPSSALKK